MKTNQSQIIKAYRRLADAEELYPPTHPEIQKRRLTVALIKANEFTADADEQRWADDHERIEDARINARLDAQAEYEDRDEGRSDGYGESYAERNA